jgi:hypothetical protein
MPVLAAARGWIPMSEALLSTHLTCRVTNVYFTQIDLSIILVA